MGATRYRSINVSNTDYRSYRFTPPAAASRVALATIYQAPRLVLRNADLVAGLSGPLVEGYSLKQPIFVSVEQEDDGLYIIDDEVFGVYGDGETREEAIKDYKRSLVEYYQLIEVNLEVNRANGSVWHLLNQYIIKQD